MSDAGDEEVAPDQTADQANALNSDSSMAVDIFISYRVRPDEPLAGELRKLLLTSIEPSPNVFISGLGGLRASADGYREQLRKAARSAKAYVGLITKASVDREWIFFEAGAAFGRGILYAPILVDVSPSELPSTIGGYQGAMANDCERVREFIEDIAKAIGRQPKARFGPRHQRFLKSVESYGKTPETANLAGLQLATYLANSGKHLESTEVFDEEIEKCKDNEARADLHVIKAMHICKDDESMLDYLESMDDSLKSCDICKLWFGILESNPIQSLRLLRDAFKGNLGSFHRQFALGKLVDSEYRLGHKEEATQRILEIFSSEDRKLRSVAADQLASHIGIDNEIERLILLIASTADGSKIQLKKTADYCWEKKYTSVGLHVAHLYSGAATDGTDSLIRGLLREQSGLYSLAFRDFRDAAKAGASVAVSNMALLLSNHPIAEAGLELFRSHTGEFDSAKPGSPYRIRAEIEDSIADERRKEDLLVAVGHRIYNAILRLFESWRTSRLLPYPQSGEWTGSGRDASIRVFVINGTPHVTIDDGSSETSELLPMSKFYAVRQYGKLKYLILVAHPIQMIRLGSFVEEGDFDWVDLRQNVPILNPIGSVLALPEPKS